MNPDKHQSSAEAEAPGAAVECMSIPEFATYAGCVENLLYVDHSAVVVRY